MLSGMPIDLKKVKPKDIDKQILRIGLIAELDAINLYEQLSAMTTDPVLKAVLAEVAEDEKEHVGAFQYLLLQRDKEQAEELEEGKEEVLEILGKKKKK
ncbi:MAG: rubrerythrin [Nanoarchaeota archaeon]|nr:rubrerythrin [Nanoarchaeota archaeon]